MNLLRNKLSIFILIIFVFWATRAFTFSPFTELLPNKLYSFLLSTFFFYILMVLPTLAYIRIILKEKSLVDYLQFTFPYSLSAFFLTVGGILVWCASIWFIYDVQISEYTKLLLLAVKTPWACIAEEILFRGLLLKELSKLYTFWKANLIQSLLFMGIHFYWLLSNPINASLLISFGTVLILGIIFGYITYKNKSLVPAILWHTFNNIITGLL